jgi:ATP-dependent RNA helicase DeaD
LHLQSIFLRNKEQLMTKTFSELGVCDEILKSIEEIGYVAPMPVQEQVIPYLLGNNNDVVALAQTGTGKTAAYGLPILQKVYYSLQSESESEKTEASKPKALVLAPTRELCVQISDDLKSYSKYIDGLHILAVYGGANIETQIRQLKKGIQVVVATPGRLVDLMERGVAKLDEVENVILDEADEMLSMGFSESIDTILAQIPSERNTLLFSATMSKEIERISKNYLHDAKEIVVGSRNEGAENVNHIYYLVHAKDKYNALKRVADYYPEIYAIIFCRTRLETQEIADKLISDGYNAESLHGELSQAQRDLTMAKFRHHHIQLLVATDVAARGLDVENLTHVINYGLPDDIESYTHRSGRTGRAGKRGTSISIIHVKEKSKVKAIEKQIGKSFVAGVLPEGEEICKKQLMKVLDDIEKVEVDEDEIAPFLHDVYRKFELMEKEDILKRVVSREFNAFLSYYKNAPVIIQPDDKKNYKDDKKSGRKGREERRRDHGDRNHTPEEGYTRLFINAGKMDGLRPREFMGFVNRSSRGQHFDLGRIDIMNKFSFFEVPHSQVKGILKALNGQEFDGRYINVEVTDNEGSGGQHESGRKGRGSGKTAYTDRKQERPARDKKKKSSDPMAKLRKKNSEVSKRDKDKPEWAQFFEGQVEDQPFYSVFAKRSKKKK